MPKLRAEQQRRFAAIAERESAPGRARAEVWVLDDSELQRETARAALGNEYDLQLFSDGATLLEAIAAGGDPCVLVLDWELPGLTGIDVATFVRKTHDELSLPILILTASHIADPDIVVALATGANDFVGKPYDAATLRARVRTLVRARRLYDRARTAEEERTDAEAKLAQEGRVRELFIGILGHDLRSPLSSVLMGAQSIARKATRDPLDTAVRIERSARRMERMISDLLDFTRSRHDGGMPLSCREGELASIVDRAVDELRGANPTRTIVFDSTGETRGLWDADRMEQVVSNLVGNAIAYSPGDTKVEVHLRSSPGGLSLEVANQGSPIPADLVPQLFDPFRRAVDEGASDRQGARGLGLGLYIVDQIVRAHGGTVTIESSRELGTRVCVKLPRVR